MPIKMRKLCGTNDFLSIGHFDTMATNKEVIDVFFSGYDDKYLCSRESKYRGYCVNLVHETGGRSFITLEYAFLFRNNIFSFIIAEELTLEKGILNVMERLFESSNMSLFKNTSKKFLTLKDNLQGFLLYYSKLKKRKDGHTVYNRSYTDNHFDYLEKYFNLPLQELPLMKRLSYTDTSDVMLITVFDPFGKYLSVAKEKNCKILDRKDRTEVCKFETSIKKDGRDCDKEPDFGFILCDKRAGVFFGKPSFESLGMINYQKLNGQTVTEFGLSYDYDNIEERDKFFTKIKGSN